MFWWQVVLRSKLLIVLLIFSSFVTDVDLMTTWSWASSIVLLALRASLFRLDLVSPWKRFGSGRTIRPPTIPVWNYKEQSQYVVPTSSFSRWQQLCWLTKDTFSPFAWFITTVEKSEELVKNLDTTMPTIWGSWIAYMSPWLVGWSGAKRACGIMRVVRQHFIF